MKSPIVSVIVPCHNQGRYLADALDSVLAQTHAGWECLIINDGSSDNTSAVASNYASRDPRIRCVQQEHRGLSAARNRGLGEARGTYIQFLDADDALAPDKFEAQLRAIASQDNLWVVYCDHYYAFASDIAERDVYTFPMPRFVLEHPLWDIATRWETELSIPIHNFLFDARIFADHPIRFNESLPNHEDWDCWMRVFALPIALKHVPMQLTAYRVHHQSMSKKTELMWKGFDEAIRVQKHIWRGDRSMQRMLSAKSAQIDAKYGYSRNPLRAGLLKLTRSVMFRRYFPWRGQKWLYRWLGITT